MFRGIWKILTLRCEEADRLQSMAPSDCTRSERIALQVHQWLCKGCKAAAEQLRLLNQTLAELRQPQSEDLLTEELSPAARDRLQARLEAAAREDSSKKE